MFHDTTLRRAVASAVPITLGAWTVQAADIIETAKQDGQFDGFVYLLEAAGMAEMLQGEGPLTVFAPTDEALGQLPPATLEWFFADENREPLEVVIQSHIVADAAIRTRDLLGRAVAITTVGGGTLAIDGTTAVIVLAPIEVTTREIEARAVVARPVSAIAGSDRRCGSPRDPRRRRGDGGRARYRGGQRRASWHRHGPSAARDAVVGLVIIAEKFVGFLWIAEEEKCWTRASVPARAKRALMS